MRLTNRNFPHFIAIVWLTALSLIAFAANSVLGRQALGEAGMDPASFTAIRLAAGAAVLWLLCRPHSVRASPVRYRSALALFVYAAAFSWGYVQLDAAVGALVLFGFVQLTLLLASVAGGRRPGALELSGLVLALIGLAVLLLPGARAPALGGATLMALAGMGWGLYTYWGSGGGDPLAASAKNFARAVLPAALLALFWVGRFEVDPVGLVCAVMSGGVTSALGYALWYRALAGLRTAGRCVAAGGADSDRGRWPSVSGRTGHSALCAVGGIGAGRYRPELYQVCPQQVLTGFYRGIYSNLPERWLLFMSHHFKIPPSYGTGCRFGIFHISNIATLWHHRSNDHFMRG